MPVSIVVGAQYGSEGKGKVAHHVVRERSAAAAVRVGGPNSGHTVHTDGHAVALRQLPTAALVPDVVCVLPPGSYLDPELLLFEIAQSGIDPRRVAVDPRATIVTAGDKTDEDGLNEAIGSTQTGVGAAVAGRARRRGGTILARECQLLQPFLRGTTALLRNFLSERRWVVIEGTQGFGLSVLHSHDYPMVTSRDATAAGALSETGLSPIDVQEVVLVAAPTPLG